MDYITVHNALELREDGPAVFVELPWLRADIAEITADVARLKADMRRTVAEMDELRAHVALLRRQFRYGFCAMIVSALLVLLLL